MQNQLQGVTMKSKPAKKPTKKPVKKKSGKKPTKVAISGGGGKQRKPPYA